MLFHCLYPPHWIHPNITHTDPYVLPPIRSPLVLLICPVPPCPLSALPGPESFIMKFCLSTDWPVGNRNMVFSSNSTSKTDISNTHPSNMDSPSENGPAVPFSTFRT
ncbi:hypothetical protein GDO81_027924 [Engystomops pustulosus]|uniref:Uncharacterized protein n=1 Tax=Engystomops pustulosus TaxID=76066 RepID=A0AAV6ZF29_ENGPU|nr:hypothetical protein GDO81_027924 [Engystomops pustulosus]